MDIYGTDDLIATCAGMGGGWRIVNINISAGDKCPNVWCEDASVVWSVMIMMLALLPASPLME